MRARAVDRFMQKVSQTESGCWLWTAATFTNGYGAFRDGPKQRRAHRWSYEHFVGPIPADAVVMHRCDVKLCVNPEHLSVGTQRENLADMSRKGRSGTRGLHMRDHCTLSLDLVGEIRTAYARGGVTQQRLADQYGVSQSMISQIINGQRWTAQVACFMTPKG